MLCCFGKGAKMIHMWHMWITTTDGCTLKQQLNFWSLFCFYIPFSSRLSFLNTLISYYVKLQKSLHVTGTETGDKKGFKTLLRLPHNTTKIVAQKTEWRYMFLSLININWVIKNWRQEFENREFRSREFIISMLIRYFVKIQKYPYISYYILS